MTDDPTNPPRRRWRVAAGLGAVAVVGGLVWAQVARRTPSEASDEGRELKTQTGPTFLLVGDEVAQGLGQALLRFVDQRGLGRVIDLSAPGCGVTNEIESVVVADKTVWRVGTDCPDAAEIARVAAREKASAAIVAFGPSVTADPSPRPATSTTPDAANGDEVRFGILRWSMALREAKIPQLWLAPPELRVGFNGNDEVWRYLAINSQGRRDLVAGAMAALAAPDPLALPPAERLQVMSTSSWEALAWADEFRRPDGVQLEREAADEQVQKLVAPALWALLTPARQPGAASNARATSPTTNPPTSQSSAGATVTPKPAPRAASDKPASKTAATAAGADKKAPQPTATRAVPGAAARQAAAARKARLAAAQAAANKAKAEAAKSKQTQARKMIDVLRLKRYRAAIARLEARRKRQEDAARHQAGSKGAPIKTGNDAGATDAGDTDEEAKDPGDATDAEPTSNDTTSAAESSAEQTSVETTSLDGDADTNNNGVPDVDEP